jgi:RNA polymerase sigma-70 factor (ECF subfamily)
MRLTPDAGDLEALVRAAQAGNTDALDQLLQSGLYIINAMVKARVREDDVEDVLQEVQLAVWEALPTLSKPGSFTVWLRKIATWTIADHYRDGDGVAPVEPIRDDLQAVEMALEEIESLAVVEEMLAGLPPRHQLVLVLRGIEELSFAEVGEEMNLTAAGSESLFRRAKLKILSRATDFDPKIPT